MSGKEYLGFNNSAFLSERLNCDRNLSIAYFMKENECLPQDTDVKRTVDLFSQVSRPYNECEMY